MASPRSGWKPGKRFQVLGVMVMEAWEYIPGIVYETTATGCRQSGAPGEIFLSPEGQKRLSNHCRWEGEKVTAALKTLIEKSPESPYVRGFIAKELGSAPPKKKTPRTTEEWMEFIDSIPDTFPPEKKKPKPPPPEETRNVHIVAYETIYGKVDFYRTDMLTGDIPVPLSVLRRSRGTVVDYVYDNARRLNRNRGDRTLTEDTSVDGDSDGIEIEEDNIDEVRRQLG